MLISGFPPRYRCRAQGVPHREAALDRYVGADGRAFAGEGGLVLRFSLHPKWMPLRIPRLIFLIGVEKTAAAILAMLGAVGVVWVHVRHIANPVRILFPDLHTSSPGIVHVIDMTVVRAVSHASDLGLVMACWALLLGAEALGIWLRRPWGELLVIVETALFLPVEIWSIVHHVGMTDILTFLVNGLVLAYVANRYIGRRHAGRRGVSTPVEPQPRREA